MPLATRARTVMTLSDVAGLARVARPVVTMWRERPLVAGIERPFPEAVDRASRVEHFDANDIVRWLTDTGRGKNPDAAADAAAYAMPRALLDGAEPSPAALDGAEALLCLRMLRGIDLGTMGADDLLDLAEEADPDDTVLFAEIESLGERATPLAAWIDNLVDAAYGALIAFDRLTARRRLTAPQRRVQLRPEADALIAQIAAALVADLGEGAVVTDATGGPTDLVRAVMDRIGEGTSTAVRVPGTAAAVPSSPTGRRPRRPTDRAWCWRSSRAWPARTPQRPRSSRPSTTSSLTTTTPNGRCSSPPPTSCATRSGTRRWTACGAASSGSGGCAPLSGCPADCSSAAPGRRSDSG